MIRRLLILLFVVGAVWLFRRITRRSTSAASRADRGGRRERADGRMVRDRVCNTYLPRESALKLSIDGREHFFCSETCRARYLEDGAARTGAA